MLLLNVLLATLIIKQAYTLLFGVDWITQHVYYLKVWKFLQ